MQCDSGRSQVECGGAVILKLCLGRQEVRGGMLCKLCFSDRLIRDCLVEAVSRSCAMLCKCIGLHAKPVRIGSHRRGCSGSPPRTEMGSDEKRS